MANLQLGQYAGALQRVDVPSYISGYVDGEGCFTVSISTPADSGSWVGSETGSVGQPEWRPLRSVAADAAVLRVREHQA